MQVIRKGDVILTTCVVNQKQKIPHLIFVKSQLTRHRHHITDEKAELHEKDNTLYLRVLRDLIACP